MSPSDPGAVEFHDDPTTPFHFNGIQKPGVLYQTLINQYEHVFGGEAGWAYTLNINRPPYKKLVEYVSAEERKLNELKQFIKSFGISDVADVEDENWDILARAALAEHRVRQVLEFLEEKIGAKLAETDPEEEGFDEEGYGTTHVWRKLMGDLRELRGANGATKRTMEEIMGKVKSEE